MPAKATHVGQQLHPPNSCGSCESSRSHEVMVIHPACLPNLWLRNWLGDVLQLLTWKRRSPRASHSWWVGWHVYRWAWRTRIQTSHKASVQTSTLPLLVGLTSEVPPFKSEDIFEIIASASEAVNLSILKAFQDKQHDSMTQYDVHMLHGKGSTAPTFSMESTIRMQHACMLSYGHLTCCQFVLLKKLEKSKLPPSQQVREFAGLALPPACAALEFAVCTLSKSCKRHKHRSHTAAFTSQECSALEKVLANRLQRIQLA